MADAWFCDEQVNTVSGAAAEALIRARSDAKYLVEGEGIPRIPLERWKVAQTFERTGWMEKWRGAGDDRNLDHAAEFNGYRSLVGRKFKNAIELGCGPFTNLRVIGDVAEIERGTLLDPLVESYLELPKCRYSRTELKTHSGGRVIPLARVHACPIEEMPEGEKFDLIVMMNVIEHCFDVYKIFEKILGMAAAGAVFVFHDCIYDAAKTAAVVREKYYEAGHPLMVGYGVMEKFMREHFEVQYFSRCADPADQIEVCPHVGRFYFVGEKK